jgi:hypothetical protein
MQQSREISAANFTRAESACVGRAVQVASRFDRWMSVGGFDPGLAHDPETSKVTNLESIKQTSPKTDIDDFVDWRTRLR